MNMKDNRQLCFQEIYDAYHTKILRYLTRMTGESEAEDLTQEVFAKIDRSLDNFRGESKLSTWIYRIATNTALDRLRSPHPEHGKRLTMDDIAETEKDKDVWTGEWSASTEQKVIREEMNGCIREIVETLPETYRAVIVLSEVEGFRDNEIAEIAGLSLQATKIRIHRARAKLKNALTKSCVLYRDDRNELACDRKAPLIRISEQSLRME